MWDFYAIVTRDSTLVKLAPLVSLKQPEISSSRRCVHSSAFARLTAKTRTRPPKSCHRFINDLLGTGVRLSHAGASVECNVWLARVTPRVGNVFHTAEKCFNLVYSRSVDYDDAIPRKKICPCPGTHWACDGRSGKRIVCCRPCGV